MIGDLLSPVHIVLLLVVALLVFGPKRLPEIGSGLGRGIREFKRAMEAVADSANQKSEGGPPSQPRPTADSDSPVTRTHDQGSDV